MSRNPWMVSLFLCAGALGCGGGDDSTTDTADDNDGTSEGSGECDPPDELELVGGCDYSGYGFCAEWYYSTASDEGWEEACEDAGGTWRGGGCPQTNLTGTCIQMWSGRAIATYYTTEYPLTTDELRADCQDECESFVEP